MTRDFLENSERCWRNSHFEIPYNQQRRFTMPSRSCLVREVVKLIWQVSGAGIDRGRTMMLLVGLAFGLLGGQPGRRGLQPGGRGARLRGRTRAGKPSGRGGSPLILSLRAARSSAEVSRLVEELKPRSGKDFTVCISAYGRVRDWRSATGLLDQMRQGGSAPNVITFSAAISACGKSGQWERALELLDEMRQGGVEPNVISYSAAISACEKGGQWERALALLQEMGQCGIEPDVIIYSAAISACEKGGQWERALELLEEMRQCGIDPDVIIYSAAISACEKGGQWERALELLEEMGRYGVEPNVYTFSAAIQACAAAGQPAPALQLFNRLEASQVDTSMCCFNAILDALCAHPDRARELWKLGCARGCYHSFERWGSSGLRLQLDLHDLSEGAAETAVRWWLEEGVRDRVNATPGAVPERLELITGWGKSRGVTDKGDVRARVETVLREMGATMLPTENLGILVVEADACIHSEICMEMWPRAIGAHTWPMVIGDRKLSAAMGI